MANKPKALTAQEYTYYRDRLGDNLMGPDDAPLSDWVLESLYADGVTPDTCGGTPEDKAQFAAYYAKRKA
jgi:hypothetical protein